MPFNIVLIEPEIPNNTGNIGRLALATGCRLHLVKPLGFEIDDSRLKRAGLDYWPHLDVHYYDHLEDFFSRVNPAKVVFLSSHAKKEYHDIPFEPELYLVFGKESVGLPKKILQSHEDQNYNIPILSQHVRSLNLANAVAIVTYEGIRKLRNI